jgi:archaellin
MNTRAWGTTALILLITTLVVASLGAHLFVSAYSGVQTHAVKTNADIQQSRVAIEVLRSTAVPTSNTAEEFAFVVRSTGSEGLWLEQLTILVNTKQETTNYVYSGAIAPTVDASTQQGTFTVTFLQTNTNHQTHVLGVGEIAVLTFYTPRSVSPRETVEVRFFPQNGLTTTQLLSMPSVLIGNAVQLYP